MCCVRQSWNAKGGRRLFIRCLLCGPSPFDSAEVPPRLQALAADTLTRTWFATSGVDSAVATDKGTVLGDPLGDLYYGFMSTRLKHSIMLRLEAEDLLLHVHRPDFTTG